MAELIILVLVIAGFLVFYFLRSKSEKGEDAVLVSTEKSEPGNLEDELYNAEEEHLSKEGERLAKEEEERLAKEKEEKERLATIEKERKDYLNKAEAMAVVYDYDGAIEYLKAYPENYEGIAEFTDATRDYEEKKAACVPFGAYQSSAEVSHIFFHSLIADNAKAFDGDYKENGYNYYMTTISEFIEMMQQLYDQGYVLVSIHDVAHEVLSEDGTVTYKEGDIMLPPDKKPFVLSQDDVNYYDYMDGDGFARRMVIDENGRPSTEMIMDDGSISVGDYDLVPVLETFLQDHPDFSYKGARGILALTGYEGALGYRTDPASMDSETYEQDKETVKEIARVMHEWGWEFACHSNGHRDMGICSDDFLVNDTDQWLKYVGSLVGETDIYIFPFGIDFENTMGNYTSNKYKYLDKSGFRYFCGVYKDPWIQVKENYVRMTRRPLDGQAMLQFPERLADLFDLSKIIDPSRPALK